MDSEQKKSVKRGWRLAGVIFNKIIQTNQLASSVLQRTSGILASVPAIEKISKAVQDAPDNMRELVSKHKLRDLISAVCTLDNHTEAAYEWCRLQQYRGHRSTQRHIYLNMMNLGSNFSDIRVFGWRGGADYLAATTGAITLEGVELGRFQIQFHPKYWSLANPNLSYSLRCVALEPNPASGDSSVTHPHVRSDIVCFGDEENSLAISRALARGDIGSAFEYVNSILHTYNGRSPHVPLHVWEGAHCDSCEEPVGEGTSEYSIVCEHCDARVCTQCGWQCECGSWCCGECRNTCSSCDASSCPNCMTECSECDAQICEGCEVICSRCGRRLCSDCAFHCSVCGNYYCSEHVTECPACQEVVCNGCGEKCASCGSIFCRGCLPGCPVCGELICEECLADVCAVCRKSVCSECHGVCDGCRQTVCSNCLEESDDRKLCACCRGEREQEDETAGAVSSGDSGVTGE